MRVLDFLRRVGPAPFPALAVGLGLRPGDLNKALRHLRGAGRAVPVRLRGVEFWSTDGVSFDAGTQETLAWFAARVEEAGGRYERGNAMFPAGTFLVGLSDGRVEFGGYYCTLQDLRNKQLGECLRQLR
jgi:hypothetical protein